MKLPLPALDTVTDPLKLEGDTPAIVIACPSVTGAVDATVTTFPTHDIEDIAYEVGRENKSVLP